MFSGLLKRAVIPTATVGSMMFMYEQLKPRSSGFLQLAESKKLSAYRPNDWVHLHYAVQSYQDNGGDVLDKEGWQLIDKHQVKRNSYFGAAYCHQQKQHIIIAHRGTEGLDAKDWDSNFDFVIRHTNEEQSVSAWDDFAKKVVERYGKDYSYSFTGHSLGGWLAQLSLWEYQNEYVRNQGYKDGFAVTVDEPGAKELLEALQPRVAPEYGQNIDELDITTYLSYPNLVNTALGHVGTVYALFPGMTFSFIEKHITYTPKVHDSQALLNEFTKEGIPKDCVRVLDWPRIVWGNTVPSSEPSKGIMGYLPLAVQAYFRGEIQRGEYTGFYDYKVHRISEIEKLPPIEQFRLKHGIHYAIKAFDEQVLPLRNMPPAMRQFLKDLSEYPDRIKIINRLIPGPISLALNAYSINNSQELVVDKTKTPLTARAFRDEVLAFLSSHPNLYQTSLRVLRDQYFSQRLQSGTLEGLLEELKEQSQFTQKLLYDLSFQQGTARLYKEIKPSWNEMKRLENEVQTLEAQLNNIQTLIIKLQTVKADKKTIQSLAEQLEQQKQQLMLTKEAVEALWLYMQGSPKAQKKVEDFIAKVSALEGSVLNRNTLLNRAYNLKAKIETLASNYPAAIASYQEATRLLPQDALTWSNYGGLLTDRGRSQNNPNLYLKAYNCFQKVDMAQLPPQQIPVSASGMAYGLLRLAQSIEEKQLPPNGLPSVTALRQRAENLLTLAIEKDPYYLNPRLFLAILRYDEQAYSVALQAVNDALTLQPIHPTALMRKGYILEKLQDPDALAVLEQALKRLEEKPTQNAGLIEEVNKHIGDIQAKRKGQSKP